MSPWFALALAPALQPWVLIGAGAATVVQAKLSGWESFLALGLYCVLALLRLQTRSPMSGGFCHPTRWNFSPRPPSSLRLACDGSEVEVLCRVGRSWHSHLLFLA